MNESMSENEWQIVSNRRKKVVPIDPPPGVLVTGPITTNLPRSQSSDWRNRSTEFLSKITEPCWFFNNGGCKHKDGTDKSADECKYQHIMSDNVRRPPHLATRKPCDKFNLEGDCRWGENCKYSHRSLTPEEWSRFYPDTPFSLKNNIQKRLQMEHRMENMEEKIRYMETRHEGMSRDIQLIGQMLQKYIRQQMVSHDKSLPL